MAKITDEIKDIASKAKGWAVATATKDGVPNVVSIAFGKVLSENQILLMDVFMKKTEENIKANPKVAASVWDMESMKGYQFKGDAKIETSGKVFDEGVQMVKSMRPQLMPKATVIVDVKEIYITSPGPNTGKLVS
jgi:hypothetical protein